MTERRQLTFSAMVSGGESGSEFIDRIKRIEQIGLTSVSMVDHFNRTYRPVPALTAAALAAPSLRVLGTVFNNDLRNPVLFANEMAAIDQPSGVRLDVGPGAGWLERDYSATSRSGATALKASSRSWTRSSNRDRPLPGQSGLRLSYRKPLRQR